MKYILGRTAQYGLYIIEQQLLCTHCHQCVEPARRGTVILGFEQATKYTVYDQDGNAVALIAEELSGIGNEIQRQLLRTRRSFKSTVLSADGEAAAQEGGNVQMTEHAVVLSAWLLGCAASAAAQPR
jgi:hypothetical protein